MWSNNSTVSHLHTVRSATCSLCAKLQDIDGLREERTISSSKGCVPYILSSRRFKINFFINMAVFLTRFTWVKDLCILCSKNLFYYRKTRNGYHLLSLPNRFTNCFPKCIIPEACTSVLNAPVHGCAIKKNAVDPNEVLMPPFLHFKRI